MTRIERKRTREKRESAAPSDVAKRRSAMLILTEALEDSRLLKEACTLARHGYEVRMYALHRQGLAERERLPDCTVERIKLRTRGWPKLWFVQLFKYLEFALRVHKRIRSFRPAVCHCHDFNALPVGVLLSWMLRIPLVYDCHEYSSIRLSRRFPRPLRPVARWVADRLEARLSRRCAGVVTVNEDLGGWFRGSNRRVVVLPNYPQLSMFRDARPAPVASRRLGRSHNLIYVGGLSRARGIADVICALDLLKGRFPDIKLVLVGWFAPPRYEEDIRALVRERGLERNVDLLGRVPYERVPGLLRLGDLGIFLPQCGNEAYAKAEPIKYFEYAAAGLPVVMSDLPASRKLIERNGNGFLVNPGDERDIACKIASLLLDCEARVQMADNGRRAFLERYNWEAVECHLTGLYDEINEEHQSIRHARLA